MFKWRPLGLIRVLIWRFRHSWYQSRNALGVVRVRLFCWKFLKLQVCFWFGVKLGGVIRIKPYRIGIRVACKRWIWAERLPQDDHALCIMPFIDLKGFLHFMGGNNVNVTWIPGYSGYSSGYSGWGYPDILGETPDIPDLVAKDSWLFDSIYASCILPWLIVL